MPELRNPGAGTVVERPQLSSSRRLGEMPETRQLRKAHLVTKQSWRSAIKLSIVIDNLGSEGSIWLQATKTVGRTDAKLR